MVTIKRNGQGNGHRPQGLKPSLQPLQLIESCRDVAKGKLRLEFERDAVFVVGEPDRGGLDFVVTLDRKIIVDLADYGIELDGVVGFPFHLMRFPAHHFEGREIRPVKGCHETMPAHSKDE